jgi:GlcNAc-P-P-Und epimerase
MKILVTGGSGFIGTNLIEKLLIPGNHSLMNLDSAKPKLDSHKSFWKECNIMDAVSLNKQIDSFRPDAVIHLAARTDTNPKNVIEDYAVNTKGSANLLDAIKNCSDTKRCIFTSTQFVHQYHGGPKHDQDFAPHTVYGESKVQMEKMIRAANLKCTWTIIRPTNIWGPWHLRYPTEFWSVLSKGLYIHPGRQPVMRSYGYVGNVVDQIVKILNSDERKIDRKIFYVGDEAIDLYRWVNGFSLRQTGRNVRVVPRIVVRLLAIAGDILSLARIGFPITTSRYKSMTSSNDAPMAPTLEAFGTGPYSLEQGIQETVEWMRRYHPELVKKIN